MNSAWKLIPLTVAVAALGACGTRVTREVIREQPIVHTAPVVQTAPVAGVTVVAPPAAPTEVIPPSPGSGYTWIAGHYEFQNGAWTWRPGQWYAGSVRPMPSPITETPGTPARESARWVPGHWAFVGNDWVWVKGQWM